MLRLGLVGSGFVLRQSGRSRLGTRSYADSGATDGAEDGVEYDIRVYGKLGGTLVHTETGLIGTSWTYLEADEIAEYGLGRPNSHQRVIVRTWGTLGATRRFRRSSGSSTGCGGGGSSARLLKRADVRRRSRGGGAGVGSMGQLGNPRHCRTRGTCLLPIDGNRRNRDLGVNDCLREGLHTTIRVEHPLKGQRNRSARGSLGGLRRDFRRYGRYLAEDRPV